MFMNKLFCSYLWFVASFFDQHIIKKCEVLKSFPFRVWGRIVMRVCCWVWAGVWCCCGWQVCDRKHLIHEATRDVLKDLVYHLITILLDTRLNELEDGQQVTRSVNVAVVKLVEKSDSTNIMRSSLLLSCLHLVSMCLLW